MSQGAKKVKTLKEATSLLKREALRRYRERHKSSLDRHEQALEKQFGKKSVTPEVDDINENEEAGDDVFSPRPESKLNDDNDYSDDDSSYANTANDSLGFSKIEGKPLEGRVDPIDDTIVGQNIRDEDPKAHHSDHHPVQRDTSKSAAGGDRSTKDGILLASGDSVQDTNGPHDFSALNSLQKNDQDNGKIPAVENDCTSPNEDQRAMDSDHIPRDDGQRAMDGDHTAPDKGQRAMDGDHTAPDEGQRSIDGDHTAPDEGQRAMDGDHTAPDDGQRAMDGDHAAPDEGQRAIDGDHNAPDKDQRAMDGDQTVPDDGKRAMDGDQTAPDDGQRAMDGDHTVPDEGQRAMDGDHAAPDEGQRAMDGDQTVPDEGQRAMNGDHAAPTDDQRAMDGDHTAPAEGQRAVEGDHTAPDKGQRAMDGDHTPDNDQRAMDGDHTAPDEGQRAVEVDHTAPDKGQRAMDGDRPLLGDDNQHTLDRDVFAQDDNEATSADDASLHGEQKAIAAARGATSPAADEKTVTSGLPPAATNAAASADEDAASEAGSESLDARQTKPVAKTSTRKPNFDGLTQNRVRRNESIDLLTSLMSENSDGDMSLRRGINTLTSDDVRSHFLPWCKHSCDLCMNTPMQHAIRILKFCMPDSDNIFMCTVC